LQNHEIESKNISQDDITSSEPRYIPKMKRTALRNIRDRHTPRKMLADYNKKQFKSKTNAANFEMKKKVNSRVKNRLTHVSKKRKVNNPQVSNFQ